VQQVKQQSVTIRVLKDSFDFMSAILFTVSLQRCEDGA
jgi:hypothetical protein